MFYKGLVIIVAMTSIVNAKLLHYNYNYHNDQISSPSEQHHSYIDEDEPVDYYAHPQYKYSYGVEDYKTGDYKTHEEERDGDVVKGKYTVADPDGTLRTVTYTVDKHSGFQAVVTKTGNEHFKHNHRTKEEYEASEHSPTYHNYYNYNREEPMPTHRSSKTPSTSPPYNYPSRQAVSSYENSYDVPKYYYRDNRQQQQPHEWY